MRAVHALTNETVGDEIEVEDVVRVSERKRREAAERPNEALLALCDAKASKNWPQLGVL